MRVILSSWGNDMRVYLAVAKTNHHGSHELESIILVSETDIDHIYKEPTRVHNIVHLQNHVASFPCVKQQAIKAN